MGVYKCPVCDGRGMVPYMFYNKTNLGPIFADVTCRSCSGKGIVFDTIEYKQKSEPKTNEFGYYTYGDYLREQVIKNEINNNQK